MENKKADKLLSQQLQQLDQLCENLIPRNIIFKIEPILSQSSQKPTLNEAESIKFDLTFSGLPNVGNTCFLNSTIQFLFGATQFREKLIEQISTIQQCSENKQKKQAFLLGSIFQLLKVNDGSPKNAESKSNKLRALSKCLQQINLQYKVNSQDDAFQTLNNLLNTIDYQLPQLSVNTYFNILSTLTCSCKLQPIHLETFFLSDRVQICSTCKNPFTKHFTNLPPYVILINLVNKDTVRRIQDKRYRLKSKINYYGNRQSGHYTCSRLEQRGKQSYFYCFNDSSVRKQKDDDQSKVENIRVALFERISQDEYQEENLKINLKKSMKKQNKLNIGRKMIFLMNKVWKKLMLNKKITMIITILLLTMLGLVISKKISLGTTKK